MKVIVSELGAWSRYVSREFFHVMTDLMTTYGWKHIPGSKLLTGGGKIREKLLREFGEPPRVVLFWESYNLLLPRAMEVFRLDCNRCIFADDLHWWGDQEGQKKFLCYAVCDTILSPYSYVFDKLYPLMRGAKRVMWVPHAASPDFAQPFNERAENAILLSGSIDHNYPFRQRMKRVHELQKFGIAYHPHPGYRCDYDYHRNDGVGQGYARKLNQYRTAFTDSSKFGYVLAKFFEIPATGALLLADGFVKERLQYLGMVDNLHYVSISSSDLFEKIEYVLDKKNHAEIDAIRKRGQALVQERHTTAHRAYLIDKLCTA
jgi:hypothetical protein